MERGLWEKGVDRKGLILCHYKRELITTRSHANKTLTQSKSDTTRSERGKFSCITGNFCIVNIMEESIKSNYSHDL